MAINSKTERRKPVDYAALAFANASSTNSRITDSSQQHDDIGQSALPQRVAPGYKLSPIVSNQQRVSADLSKESPNIQQGRVNGV